MNPEQAQFTLRAYRPNGQDARDPQFQEALALARQDPRLGRWLAEQEAFDRALAAKLRARPVPPDLKARLLLARTNAASARRWRWPGGLALAACCAFVFIAGSLLTQHAWDARFVRFRAAMANAALARQHHADVEGLDVPGFQRWLAEHHGDPGFALPPGWAHRGIAACRIVAWRESRVTMLCVPFAGGHVDLFVIAASELPGLSLDSTPTLFADGRITSAAWRHEGRIYLAAGTMPAAELKKLL